MFNKIGFNLLIVSVIALCITYIAADQELSNSYLVDAPVNKGNFLQRIKRDVVIGRKNIRAYVCVTRDCSMEYVAPGGNDDDDDDYV